tara:strand:+ start:160 stop:999 length:840 start_codon:yes stop_codon:yes gene_type:complete
MYDELKKIAEIPRPFEFYTADTLWTDEHISKQMLTYHLDENSEPASRPKAFIDCSADWLKSRFNIGPGVRIADFGCGPGLYTTRFAKLGAEVTGIDFSQRSINYAKKTAAEENLSINYVLSNYLEFASSEKFDLITMIYCDFCALSPEQRGRLLRIFRDILADGGAVALDVFSLNAFAKREEVSIFERNQLNGFWSPNDYYCFLKTTKYDEAKVVLDKYSIVDPNRTFHVYNWLQYFSVEALMQEFSDNGLKVIEKYSDIAGTTFYPDSDEMAVIAVKA